VAEQLITGTDRQDYHIRLGCVAQARGFACQVSCRYVHLFVLAAMEKDQIEPGKVGAISYRYLGNGSTEASPFASLRNGHQIATVAGDAEQCRI
jgi:hypothetical protein